MNTHLITAPADVAREKRDAYRRQLAKRSDPEYAAAAEIYEILAKNGQAIDVGVAIRAAGFDAKMRPKLALARADRKQVRFTWDPHSDLAAFDANVNAGGWGRKYPQFVEQINMNRRHGRSYITPSGQRYGTTVEGFALVPMIPPEVRPSGHAAQWHILWEVEEWADRRIGAKPPVDPYLLRRVHGDLFEVLAAWDLTEVERYVMAGRARVQP